MENEHPSIFNDVIGPVMRGPSSSHCAAALRIGRIARDLMGNNIKEVEIYLDPAGSLATTHESQGSDMGLCGGFLGWDVTDKRLINYQEEIKKAGIKIKVAIKNLAARHPNTYKIILRNEQEVKEITALSTGGGIIEITRIDDFALTLKGDYYETLIYTEDKEISEYLDKQEDFDYIICHRQEGQKLIQLKGQKFLNRQSREYIEKNFKITSIKELNPVLPVLSSRKDTVPFTSCQEMLRYNKSKKMQLWELAQLYESKRGKLSAREVMQKMELIVKLMKKSIKEGLKGTKYKDRILGYQSGGYLRQLKNQLLLDGGVLNKIIPCVTSLMEIKSSMGLITAAPTAGSCGALIGTCMGAADALGLPEEKIIKGLLAAGIIGVFICTGATFAAEVGGCQAECGAGSGMAAAALVSMAGGNISQALSASSLALQNILGMVCDPVANRVEVPCLGKNVMAAANALACANMALAGYDEVIPLDEVIETMDRVGKSLPLQLRCTALGGLSITPTSRKIEKELARRTRKKSHSQPVF